MLRALLPLALVFSLGGCDGIKKQLRDMLDDDEPSSAPKGDRSSAGASQGSGTSASRPSGGGGGGGSDEPAKVGARPVQQGAGASNLIRQVAGGGGPAPGITSAQCNDLTDGGPVPGPDCITAEIKCGETIVGHTRGGVNLYNTRFYERNFCWPGTRNHNAGDERVYLFVPDKSPRFQAGENRQRVSVFFDSPCADLTFTKMVGTSATKCPRETAKLCDSANPFTRKMNRNTMHLTVDRGEIYYFLVEGADDENGAFAITVECGT
ncbi:MAG: hypothetical protein EA397_02895 [Deltaproteobacteria bacterium]|nr:MAG: hypothetical protein EA397_02895 [Deltaproteobacteria bacterium]